METAFRPLPNLREKFFVSENVIQPRIQYLQLPESSEMQGSGPNGTQCVGFPITDTGLRADKLKRFAERCSWAMEHVYFGGEGVASRLDKMKANGITHVVNCVRLERPNYFENDLKYLTLYLQDSGSEDILSVLYDVFDFIEEARETGGRVFVHCSQGVSRSAALVIAYVMWRKKQSFEVTKEQMEQQRRVVDPNLNFCTQLYYWEQRFTQSQSSFLRVYRIKPQSRHDPCYLVPKTCLEIKDNIDELFDPRGAFVIHAPNKLFIWIGKKYVTNSTHIIIHNLYFYSRCQFQYIEAARRFCRQLRKYEGAPPSAIEVYEQKESGDFLSVLSANSSSIIDSIQASEQEQFTIDYERFNLNLHHSLTDISLNPSSSVELPLSTRRAKSGPLPE
eukprot:g5264.t1